METTIKQYPVCGASIKSLFDYIPLKILDHYFACVHTIQNKRKFNMNKILTLIVCFAVHGAYGADAAAQELQVTLLGLQQQQGALAAQLNAAHAQVAMQNAQQSFKLAIAEKDDNEGHNEVSLSYLNVAVAQGHAPANMELGDYLAAKADKQFTQSKRGCTRGWCGFLGRGFGSLCNSGYISWCDRGSVSCGDSGELSWVENYAKALGQYNEGLKHLTLEMVDNNQQTFGRMKAALTQKIADMKETHKKLAFEARVWGGVWWACAASAIGTLLWVLDTQGPQFDKPQ